MALDADWTRRWIALVADRIAERKAELSHLDRDIGDGDHGENLDRGFTAVRSRLADLDADATPGAILKLVATTLISTVGGASGPLYGTAFLKAAMAAGDAATLDDDLVAVLAAARDGIVARGKAEPGDKTMVDAWTPAVDAAAAAPDAVAALAAAADAAEAGAKATEPLVARKGRASYLGERAIGHRDPGSESTALILRAAADA
ncbi:dihydroxyacetone kinase subunit DhaL [Agrococcus jejuensis]|uniref:Dihydroxyacetone kinase DhaL subunit n=1 Tax=Agrococcus jejuensis TaxID=399736 RepID=A0A1G8H1W0_9MICO|nr:dihydroxyacetone kinase subunit DhaL [Agrococcus jejuensis]SDI00655.1 dihydroxyacetone kinase DhaL subunit [Agrococcus jejuensis]